MYFVEPFSLQVNNMLFFKNKQLKGLVEKGVCEFCHFSTKIVFSFEPRRHFLAKVMTGPCKFKQMKVNQAKMNTFWLQSTLYDSSGATFFLLAPPLTKKEKLTTRFVSEKCPNST